MPVRPLVCALGFLLLTSAPAATAATGHDLGGATLGAQIERDLAPASCSGLEAIGSRATALFTTRGAFSDNAGDPDFAGVDADVDGERACGIEPGLRVSAKSPTTDDGYPADPDAYAALLTALSTHLTDRVSRYAIDNEAAAGNHFPGDATEYYSLLRLASGAIHAGDPRALVVDASMSYGTFGVVYADRLLADGRAADAVALIQEVQANELGGGPPVRDEDDLRAYLADPKAQRALDFFNQAVANQDAYDVFQMHYYGPSQGIAGTLAMARRLGITRPIEIWELNHRYLDDRPYDPGEQAAETARLLLSAVGEGSRWTVFTNYFDHLENSNYGLVDAAGVQRPAARSFASVSAAVTGATAARQLALDGNAVGYGYDSAQGYSAAAWTSSGVAHVAGRALGVDATTALVTSAVDGTARHRRVDRLDLDASPVLVAPDQVVVAKRRASKRRLRLAVECPHGSAFGHCAGRLRALDKRGRVVGELAYRVKRGETDRLGLRLEPHARKPRRLRADASRCAVGRRCRSSLRL